MEEAYAKKNIQDSSDDSIESIDLNKFFDDCYEFIKEPTSETEKRYRISKVMKCVPLSMTKEKYFDYVRQSLEIEMKNLSQTSISQFLRILLENFNPLLLKDYDSLVPELIQNINENIELLKSPLDDEQLDNISEQVGDINDMLGGASEYFYMIYKDLNHLLILLLIDFDMEFITGNNPIYRDLYKTVSMVLDEKTSQEDKETYCETAIDLLNDHIDKVLETQTKVEDNLKKLIYKYDDTKYKDTELEKLIYTNLLFYEYINKDLAEDIYAIDLDDSSIADESNIKREIDESIEFLRKQIESMNAKERKIYMQNFLALLFPIWNEEDTISYVESSH